MEGGNIHKCLVKLIMKKKSWVVGWSKKEREGDGKGGDERKRDD